MNINKVKDIIPITIIEEETTLKIILKYIEHHKDHYLNLNLFGKKFHPCARCFGYWSGLLFGFFLLSPFWLGIVHAGNFSLVFAIAWLFAIPTIADWAPLSWALEKEITRFAQ